MISFEDFKKVEIKIGKILSAEKVVDADKLLKLSVDFGPKSVPMQEVVATEPVAEQPVQQLVQVAERDIRQIVSGIAMHFPDPSVLVGKLSPFVVNLEPRVIRGLESQGMILAVGSEGAFSLLETNSTILPGTLVK